MQSSILYYDKSVENACFNICETLKIDNMPSYNSKFYYELQGGKFERKRIRKNLKLETTDRIFDVRCIRKFKNNKHNVLFVFEGEILKGVVHFADYNKNNVLKRVQDDILTFELNLREYLILNSYRNEDVISFFEYKLEKMKNLNNQDFLKNKLKFLRSKKDQMENLGVFQLFDLSDLMHFCNSSFSGPLFKFENHSNLNNESGDKIISSIRNMAMHGKNPIEKNQDTSIYSIESLLNLKIGLEILNEYNSKLEELIHLNGDYQKSIQLENQNKLKIIHEHHPKALKYFIGY